MNRMRLAGKIQPMAQGRTNTNYRNLQWWKHLQRCTDWKEGKWSAPWLWAHLHEWRGIRGGLGKCVCWWQVMPVGGVSHHSLDAVTGRFASSKSNYLTVLGLTISKMGNSILIPISSKVKVENLDHRYSMKWLLLLFIYLGFECLEIDIQGWAAWNS